MTRSITDLPGIGKLVAEFRKFFVYVMQLPAKLRYLELKNENQALRNERLALKNEELSIKNQNLKLGFVDKVLAQSKKHNLTPHEILDLVGAVDKASLESQASIELSLYAETKFNIDERVPSGQLSGD